MSASTTATAFLSLLLALLSVSCGGGGSSHNETTVVQSNLPRNAAPSVTSQDTAAVVAGNSAFAFDLYAAVRQGTGNSFFSPYSISVALAMLYAGAGGNTETQMAATMHYTLPQDRLHASVNWLDLALAGRGQGAAGQDGGPFRLEIANSIWGQTGYSFLTPFLDTIALNYGAGLRLLDFQTDPEQCRVTINDWVSDNTEGRIQDLVTQGSITPLTRLVLCNAIYFNAKWLSTFARQNTRDMPFNLLDGRTATVRMMSQTQSFRYAEGDGYQAVELPYDGNEISMLVLLPASGRFPEFEGGLTSERAGSVVSSLAPRQVALSMPKFSYTTTLALKDTLSAMGMRDAFVPGTADLSGIDGTRELFVGAVLHKAFVRVDEEGTEAAAATAVVVGTTSAPLDPVVVNVDRPFVVLIRDLATGTILFLGRVTDPTAQ
jgi:serpin B